MICHHKNTIVYDSRPPDAINSRGEAMFKPLAFDCFVVRRRRCADCDYRWITYEVSKQEVNRLLKMAGDRKTIEQGIIQQIIDGLSAQTSGAQ